MCVVDSGFSGFNLHKLDDGKYVRNYSTGAPIKNVPKQVAFAENAKVIVGGSDHGSVYVFERESGNTLQVLRHSENTFVQTVTVSLTVCETDSKLTNIRLTS